MADDDSIKMLRAKARAFDRIAAACEAVPMAALETIARKACRVVDSYRMSASRKPAPKQKPRARLKLVR